MKLIDKYPEEYPADPARPGTICFVPNIFKAAAADYRNATQRIYRAGQYASNITLPVVTTGSRRTEQ